MTKSIRVCRLLAVLLMAALMVSLCSGSLQAIAETAENTTKTELKNPEEIIDERDGYILKVHTETGEFEITNGTNSWKSNPDGREDAVAFDVWKGQMSANMIINYSNKQGKIQDTVNTYNHSRRKNGMKVFKKGRSLLIEYHFETTKCTVPLEITLGEGGTFEATVNFDNIVYTGETFIVTGVQLLPFFGAANEQDQGYMLVPDGSGALINLNNKKSTEGIELQVYNGDDAITVRQRYSRTFPITLPVLGMNKGSTGFFAVMTEGDSMGKVYAQIAGNKTSYNNIWAGFSTRSFDQFSLRDHTGATRTNTVVDKHGAAKGKVTVRYFLMQGDCSYMAMADLYRQYLLKEKGFNISQTAKPSEVFLDLYGTVIKKQPVLGIPVDTVQRITDYQDAQGMVETLRESGIDDITIRYINATKASVKKAKASATEYYNVLGSKKDLESLKKAVGEQNLYIELDTVNVKMSGFAFWAFDQISKNMLGLPAYRAPFNLATGQQQDRQRWMMYNSPRSIEIFSDVMEKMGKSGRKYVYIADYGEKLTSNFESGGTSREDAKNLIVAAMSKANESSGTFMVNKGNAYILPYINRLTEMPMTSSGNSAYNDDIPFFQVLLNGIISYAGPALNLSSNIQRDFLKAIESGGNLHFSLINQSPTILKETELSWNYGSSFELWKEDIADYYRQQQEVIQATGGSVIADHVIVANGVAKVTFENGAVLYVNYNHNAVTYEGVTVGALDYIIEGGQT